MSLIKIKDRVINNDLLNPYYEKYRGHVFRIDHEHPDDKTGEHIWLECISDPTVKVDGYVHRSEIEPIEEHECQKSKS